MNKKLLALMIILPMGISAMSLERETWNRSCDEVYKALVNRTTTYDLLLPFLGQKIQDLSKLKAMAIKLQDHILANAEMAPSENALASLYFLHEAATKCPCHELNLTNITSHFEIAHQKALPSILNNLNTLSSKPDVGIINKVGHNLGITLWLLIGAIPYL